MNAKINETGHIVMGVSIIFLVLQSLLTSCNAQTNKDMSKLEIGSYLPIFSLPEENGKLFDINTLLGKKNLVIYFYPKDDTPGCTKEACKFRDSYEAFSDAGAVVIGISSDNAESHRKFIEKYHLNFTLLSDIDGKVRKQFGVSSNLMGMIDGRVTYVVNKQGVVVHIFNSQSEAERHVTEALKALNGIGGCGK